TYAPRTTFLRAGRPEKIREAGAAVSVGGAVVRGRRAGSRRAVGAPTNAGPASRPLRGRGPLPEPRRRPPAASRASGSLPANRDLPADPAAGLVPDAARYRGLAGWPVPPRRSVPRQTPEAPVAAPDGPGRANAPR